MKQIFKGIEETFVIKGLRRYVIVDGEETLDQHKYRCILENRETHQAVVDDNCGRLDNEWRGDSAPYLCVFTFSQNTTKSMDEGYVDMQIIDSENKIIYQIRHFKKVVSAALDAN